jgi:hypothetical protein
LYRNVVNALCQSVNGCGVGAGLNFQPPDRLSVCLLLHRNPIYVIGQLVNGGRICLLLNSGGGKDCFYSV